MEISPPPSDIESRRGDEPIGPGVGASDTCMTPGIQ
jgi:hypothetical protein